MPKKPKKTLIAKLFIDVSDFSDAVIDLQKAFMCVAADDDTRVEFEVIVENEEIENATAERLLHLVRSEFKEHDKAPDVQAAEEKEAIVLSDEQLRKFRELLASGKDSDNEATEQPGSN
jgi:hypothetical protein